MFFVIDKSKIFSYVIAICTVVILFVAAVGLNNMSSSENSVTTSTNSINSNTLNDSGTSTNSVASPTADSITTSNTII